MLFFMMVTTYGASMMDGGSVPEPSRAALYSAIFPGAGQFYVGNRVKGFLFGAAGAYFGYRALRDLSISGGSTDSPAFPGFMDNALSFVAVWGLSIVDAYISAHLYGFDSSIERVIKVDVSGSGIKLGIAIIN